MKVRIHEGMSHLDILNAELKESFTTLKMRTERLSMSFRRLGQAKRSKRIHFCANDLAFGHDEDGYKLHDAAFCRERLCPMCASRRARKTFGQVYDITNYLKKDGIRFIFLTLTVPNCSGDMLGKVIDRMQKAFHRLVNYKQFKDSILGFFRALEVTRNNRRKSKSFGTFHPHFHCILAVSADYFTSDKYISRDEFLNLWCKAYQDFTITQVDVRTVKNTSGDDIDDLAKACAEVAKYTVKSKDYIRPDDEETDEIVETLQKALYRRRLTAFGGCFKIVRDLLGLDDNEDGDLVHTETHYNDSDAVEMRRYTWRYDLMRYHLVSEMQEIKVPGVGWVSLESVRNCGLLYDDSGGDQLEANRT